MVINAPGGLAVASFVSIPSPSRLVTVNCSVNPASALAKNDPLASPSSGEINIALKALGISPTLVCARTGEVNKAGKADSAKAPPVAPTSGGLSEALRIANGSASVVKPTP